MTPVSRDHRVEDMRRQSPPKKSLILEDLSISLHFKCSLVLIAIALQLLKIRLLGTK